VYVATGGARVSETRLKELRDAVETLAREVGYPDSSSRSGNADFDQRLAALMHSTMGLVPAEAASREVWAFLSLVLMPDLAYWRYPSPTRDSVLGTDLTRHVFGRMWWRAQLIHSPEEEDPYAALGILGEAAFDQIYARRKALGGSPHLVKAILTVWNEVALAELTNLNKRDTLRDFLKRLLRLAPFVTFDSVEASALEDELRATLRESVTAVLTQTRGAELDATQLKTVIDAAFAGSPLERERPTPPTPAPVQRFTSLELCAGAGGQALGLERAGFDPVLLIDNKPQACETLTLNRPHWKVQCGDLLAFDPQDHPETLNLDLISGGLPRLLSAASATRGDDTDERKVFETAVNLVETIHPKALLLENIPDFIDKPSYDPERTAIESFLNSEGYRVFWQVLDAVNFGVPQNRRCGFLVAMAEPYAAGFSWPSPFPQPPSTVAETLGPSMSADGWPGATSWIAGASAPGPTLVGGSDNRGGADLGPTGSKKAWLNLGVDGNSLADAPPIVTTPIDGPIKLTLAQTALLQSFPEEWSFAGGKTKAYRQIGHALPPTLATAVGTAIAAALSWEQR
jgi:site-specific DNA-cytosine methylase